MINVNDYLGRSVVDSDDDDGSRTNGIHPAQNRPPTQNGKDEYVPEVSVEVQLHKVLPQGQQGNGLDDAIEDVTEDESRRFERAS